MNVDNSLALKHPVVDYRFKVLYALGAVLICCGHVEGGGITLLSDWFPLYPTHLVLFTFAAGYFYKDNVEQHIGTYIWKKFKKLVVPIYIYIILRTE